MVFLDRSFRKLLSVLEDKVNFHRNRAIMMKIVLKVAIVCCKCKTCILTIVSKLEGIKSLAFDDEKSTLTVVADTDVVDIVEALRKAKKPVQVVTVGDEKKEEEKKEKEKKKRCEELLKCCNTCRPYYVTVADNRNTCIIA